MLANASQRERERERERERRERERERERGAEYTGTSRTWPTMASLISMPPPCRCACVSVIVCVRRIYFTVFSSLYAFQHAASIKDMLD